MLLFGLEHKCTVGVLFFTTNSLDLRLAGSSTLQEALAGSKKNYPVIAWINQSCPILNYFSTCLFTSSPSSIPFNEVPFNGKPFSFRRPHMQRDELLYLTTKYIDLINVDGVHKPNFHAVNVGDFKDIVLSQQYLFST